MLTALDSDFRSASPSELALSAALAVLFAALGYRMSVRHRAVRGVTPWRLPSVVWALICLVLQFLGLALEIVAELTTRSPWSAAPFSRAEPPPNPEAASETRSAYAPPATPPVAVGPVSSPSSAPDTRSEAGQDEVATPWPSPPPDERGQRASFGWYPDPTGRHRLRYYDGRYWSQHALDGDQLSEDPL